VVAAALVSLALAAGAFDHSDLDRLLKAHVRDGRVDYDAFARAPAFPRYLASLSAARPDTLPPQEQMAFWINAYNAYTIELLNSHGERQSILNVSKVLGVRPWSHDIVKAGGRTVSLDFVEHEILRKRFQEPRIHFALVCAARSCPPLRSEAYTGATLEAQLEDQARTFIARTPSANRVDVPARTVYLSPIFGWYKADFPDLGPFLARYFPAGPERALLESGQFKTIETEYDWSLNGN
jgi:hypothetical protein